MTNELGNMQFSFVDIQPGVNRNRDTHTVDINFSIKEGQKTFVERININGNSRTLDEVVRREMTLVGATPSIPTNSRNPSSGSRIWDFFDKVEVKPQPRFSA